MARAWRRDILLRRPPPMHPSTCTYGLAGVFVAAKAASAKAVVACMLLSGRITALLAGVASVAGRRPRHGRANGVASSDSHGRYSTHEPVHFHVRSSRRVRGVLLSGASQPFLRVL